MQGKSNARQPCMQGKSDARQPCMPAPCPHLASMSTSSTLPSTSSLMRASSSLCCRAGARGLGEGRGGGGELGGWRGGGEGGGEGRVGRKGERGRGCTAGGVSTGRTHLSRHKQASLTLAGSARRPALCRQPWEPWGVQPSRAAELCPPARRHPAPHLPQQLLSSRLHLQRPLRQLLEPRQQQAVARHPCTRTAREEAAARVLRGQLSMHAQVLDPKCAVCGV